MSSSDFLSVFQSVYGLAMLGRKTHSKIFEKYSLQMAPPVNFICAWNTVNSWLWIYSKKSIYVHCKQDILNGFRFSFNWGNSLYPWQMLNFSFNKTNKYSTNILKFTFLGKSAHSYLTSSSSFLILNSDQRTDNRLQL